MITAFIGLQDLTNFHSHEFHFMKCSFPHSGVLTFLLHCKFLVLKLGKMGLID